MIGFMISQGFLVAQVWIPPATQMYQPSLNVPPGQWGTSQQTVQPQKPGYRRGYGKVQPSVQQPSGISRSHEQACPIVRQFIVDYLEGRSAASQSIYDSAQRYEKNNCHY